MSVLDERQQTPSLKLIVMLVSLLTFGAFGTMFLLHNGHEQQPASATQQARTQPAATEQQQETL